MVKVEQNKNFDTVCVVGLGYIGLPTATFIANSGYNVVGVDINEEYVNLINQKKVPFHEPGFSTLLSSAVDSGFLSAQVDMPEADVYIVAVPTPFKEGHEVDDKYIMAAAANIAQKVQPGNLVILESTSPPGTTHKLAERVCRIRKDLTIEDGHPNTVYFAHCPERVLPGAIVKEMVSNDRVIGGLNSRSAHLAEELYRSFCRGKMLLTDATTAEMAKLVENSYRDVNIAFANELSIIADDLGVDVWELIKLANHHPRVNILQPGPGVGGHCIAVDPWFIVSAAPQASRLIRTAREINDYKPQHVLEKISKGLLTVSRNSPIAVLGLAFKADIDDLRESPAVEIAQKVALNNPDRSIKIVEPFVEELPESFAALQNVELSSLESAIQESEIVVLLVDHTAFKKLANDILGGKVIVDTRGILR